MRAYIRFYDLAPKTVSNIKKMEITEGKVLEIQSEQFGYEKIELLDVRLEDGTFYEDVLDVEIM